MKLKPMTKTKIQIYKPFGSSISQQDLPLELIKDFKDDLDMIVGSRTGSNVKIPLIRKPAKWFIGKLANYVTNVNIPDINSGLRIFKKSSFMPFIQIIPDGFSLTTTITLGMISNGYRVKFIPIDYFHSIGSSKIKPIKDTMNFIVLIFKIGLYFAPMKIFFPIGAFLLLLSCGLALFSLIFLGKLADLSTLIIALSGIQVLVMSLLAHLINFKTPNIFLRNK